MCHTLHDAPSGFKLLPAESVKATCFTCHDGTAGFGVYGAVAARGLTVGGGHSVDTTTVVPGGNATTGGSASTVFRGPSGTMTCSDCHSPHESDTIAPFVGERVRLRAAPIQSVYSDKLLKKRPTGSEKTATVYGSDWCMTCHKGRSSGGMVLNHPVESKLTQASPYYYNNLPTYWCADTAAYELGLTQTTTWVRMGAIGNIALSGSVRHPTPGSPSFGESWVYQSPWLMAYPRTALHSGHAPICQQCHEDSRECGELSVDGTAAVVVGDRLNPVDADGRIGAGAAPNPRFQNFPHETQNSNMLVETADDLCLNCHPMAQLP